MLEFSVMLLQLEKNSLQLIECDELHDFTSRHVAEQCGTTVTSLSYIMLHYALYQLVHF